MRIDYQGNYRIILASRSPRRQQMLQELGLEFDIVIREYPETYPEGLDGKSIAEFISHQKADSFKETMADNEIVITADTIVWCNNKVLGKPRDYSDAVYMLREISGNTHEVITGVTLLSRVKEKTFSVSSKVTFDHLTSQEISFYINKYQPFDKAGAYGIQEWIGLVACSRIEGSYFNVVGLPVRTLYRELQNFVSGDWGCRKSSFLPPNPPRKAF
jgi:septum formation protein